MENGNSGRAFSEVAGDVKNYLRFLSDMGCTGFECSSASCETVNGWGRPRPVRVKKRSVLETLEDIRIDLGDCRRCGLASGRDNIVFGAGNPKARLVFVGDAPDVEEDMQGLPFVGGSGQLLTRMIQAMGLSREEVYICNIVKCHSSEKRKPLPEELNACMVFLKRQIQVIKPEIICTLGAFATQSLLGNVQDVSKLRGHFQDYQGIRVMPTFHPIFLMKNPASKKEAWEDLKKIIAALD